MAHGKGDGEGVRSLFDSLLGRGDGDGDFAIDDDPIDADRTDDGWDEGDGSPVEGEEGFVGDDGRPEDWDDEDDANWWETVAGLWRGHAGDARDDDDEAIPIAEDEEEVSDPADGDGEDPGGDASGGVPDGDAPETADEPGDKDDEEGRDDREAPVDDPGDEGDAVEDAAEDEAGEPADAGDDASAGDAPAGESADEASAPVPAVPAKPVRHRPVPSPGAFRGQPLGSVPGRPTRLSPEPVSPAGAVRDATHSFGSRADDVLLPNAQAPLPAGSREDSRGSGVRLRWVAVASALAALAGFAVGVISHVELPTDEVSVTLGSPVASASVAANDLDATVATLSYKGKAIEVSFREAIEAAGPLSDAALPDGSYAAPSSEDALAAARGEVILADAAERGIDEGDAVSSWVSDRYGLSSVADLAKAMGASEEEALRQVRGPAVAQALMAKAVGAGFPSAPSAPYEPASGDRTARVARYATYVRNLDEQDPGLADAALAGYAYDGEVASYDMAVAAYEEALSRWETRSGRLEARWEEYLNGLLDDADIHIRTCAVPVDGEGGDDPDAPAGSDDRQVPGDAPAEGQQS